MPPNFNKEMSKYLANKRRNRLFSDIRLKVMNKKAVLSYKAANKFEELKGKLTSKAKEVKKEKKERKIKDFPTSKSGDFEEPKKEIIQEQVDDLLERKGIKIGLKEGIEPLKRVEEEGWEEIKIPSLEEKKQDMVNLEEEKRKLQGNLFKMQEKEKAENERLARLIEEHEQRSKTESEEDKLKRIELEEEIRVLKEKEKIEEERLAELRKVRRREQMEALRGRVTDILFKKKPKIIKDMAEEVRKEIRREVKIREAEKQKVEAKELKQVEEKPQILDARFEEIKEERKIKDTEKSEISGTTHRGFPTSKSGDFEEPKTEVKETLKSEERKEKPKVEDLEKPKEEVTKVEGKSEEKKEIKETEEKKEPKKSFFSNFIQIKTGEEIAKEEEERLKQEEEQALKGQLEINKIFQEEGEEVKTNMPAEEQSINLSTLFQEEQPIQKQIQDSEDVIELDQGYRIKVIKN